jgi:hypothetical protein
MKNLNPVFAAFSRQFLPPRNATRDHAMPFLQLVKPSVLTQRTTPVNCYDIPGSNFKQAA